MTLHLLLKIWTLRLKEFKYFPRGRRARMEDGGLVQIMTVKSILVSIKLLCLLLIGGIKMK